MDKIEQLLEMQKLLDAISSRMDEIKEDLNCITSCVQEKRLISVEVLEHTMCGLIEINNMNEKCKKMYASAGLDKDMSEEIETIEKDIAQAISDIKVNSKLAKYKRFLLLETDDTETKILLDAKKDELQKKLDGYTADREKELEPYAKFIEAIQETDYAKIVALILELSQAFGNDLIGKAVMQKTIKIPADEKITELDEKDSGTSETQKVKFVETFDFNEDNISAASHDKKENIVKTDENKEEIASANEYVPEEIACTTEVISENVEESKVKEEIVEKGLLITDDVFDKSFFAHISNAESNKVGAKIFKNEMSMLNTSANIVSLAAMEHFAFSTAEMIAISSNMSVNKIELALDHLYKKGYVREYGVSGIGSFYCPSPRFWKAMQAREARKILKVKSTVSPTADDYAEDTLNQVLASIGCTKLLEKYLDKLDAKKFNISETIWNGTFAYRMYNESKDKAYVFVGAFFKDGSEADKLIENIQEVCFDGVDNCHYVVTGIDFDYTNKLADFLLDKVDFDADKLYCYLLTEDRFIKYGSNETVEFDSMFNVEEIDSKENSDEISAVEVTEKSYNSLEEKSKVEYAEIKEAVNEVITETEADISKKSENISDMIETQISEINEDERKVEIKEADIEIDVNSVMQDVYQMIVNDKTYCATTYLRSLMDDNSMISENYEKLAYAVNAPWMRCSYNSQKIFALYSTGNDLFSKYLMAAASLRNYFMNHVSFDYSLKALQASIKELSVVKNSIGLTNAIYILASFKETIHKGVDVYAAYRAKDKVVVNKALDVLCRDAKMYYDNYVLGQPKNHKNVKRFLKTWNLIFSKERDLAVFLQAVLDKDNELADICRGYLIENFIGDGCSLDYANIDNHKVDKFIDKYWDKALKNGATHYKTTPLMSDLRNNLIKAIDKVLKLLCDWITLVDATGSLVDDEGSKRFMTIKKKLIENLQMAVQDAEEKGKSTDIEEAAGAVVLRNTIEELLARLEGNYDEKMHKYYYIDFLRGNEILLDEEFLPDMRGKFVDFEELSLSNRILRHSNSKLMTFEEKLDYIFNNYGDDYGTAELIAEYLTENGVKFDEDKYNVKESVEKAEADAKIKLDDFIENLELAQSCGQIEETKENKKEKIQKIAYEWFDYANESKNYGFFNMVLEKYRLKIHEDAKVRGKALLKELDKIKEVSGDGELMQKRIYRIQEMIDAQNYTVAEDLLSRINSDESDEEYEVNEIDYLQKFIDDYDYNYKIVSNSSKKVSDLVKQRIHNKDDKGASRLISNWMSNGQALNTQKLSVLLDALGFSGANVQKQPKIGKIENYLVTLKEVKGRKVNYKHPIAAFGSKAVEDGFRTVCLFGKFDADRLIEEFKNIGGTKNTLVLLDYALPLAERRRLARKIKSDMGDKVFAVLDRVLLMFLANNYSVQFINQILMSTMMPFSYYQPYVWDSSKVMQPEIFIGRKEELEKIESSAGVNIVYGGRQLGKSALLKMAQMNIDNDDNHDRAVYIEIKGMDYRRAAKKISNELYDRGILDTDINTTDWDELARAIKRRLQDKKLPYIPYFLLLLDEADVFIESCEEVTYQPFDALKDIQSIGMDRFKFVIAGLHNIVRFKRDAALSKNSVLTQLTSITITPFSLREARQLLEEPLYCLGLRFPKDKQSLVSLILANTNYFPGLIQLYCANLIEAMRKGDYAGYDQADTPAYEVNPNHIKKVLSDTSFMNQVREKFEITLKLDEDNMYYIIALLMAYLYHQNANSASEIEGFSAKDIIKAAKDYSVKKVMEQPENVIDGLMQELLELNIFRQTVNNLYLFSRYSFFQMMGTTNEVDDKLEQYMEE